MLKDQLATLVDTLVAISEPSASGSSFLTLPRDYASLAIAREHVRRQLHTWALPSLVDAVVLVVSELAGNAVEHARSGFDLRLELRNAKVLRVEVVDHGPGSPELQLQDTRSARGRGLHLVSQLSTSWGTEAIDGNGKTVWAELLTGDPP